MDITVVNIKNSVSVFVYIADVLIETIKTKQEHSSRVKAVLEVLNEAIGK